MNKDGFTLIEIIVAMAILSILVGTLAPMMYRVWESSEIAVTRERMVDLKTAIAGSRDLFQNGLRTHYGFVGDVGILPDSLDDLVIDSGSWPSWNGPYLGGGFHPTNYKLDAWSNPIIYTEHSPPLSASGESIAATLRSAGPDRISGTSDDIDEDSDLDLQILSKDIWPTATIQGNLNLTATATTTATPSYYFNLLSTFRNGVGMATTTTGCIALNIGTVEADVPKNIVQAFATNFAVTLPIGKVLLRSRLFSDSGCTTLLEETSDMAIFISDGLNELSINPPTLYYRIN